MEGDSIHIDRVKNEREFQSLMETRAKKYKKDERGSWFGYGRTYPVRVWKRTGRPVTGEHKRRLCELSQLVLGEENLVLFCKEADEFDEHLPWILEEAGPLKRGQKYALYLLTRYRRAEEIQDDWKSYDINILSVLGREEYRSINRDIVGPLSNAPVCAMGGVCE